MAVHILSHPFQLDFAGNRPQFVLRGNPVITRGTTSEAAYQITEMPAVGSTIRLEVGGQSFVFVVATIAQADGQPDKIGYYAISQPLLLKQELERKLAGNYKVRQFCSITIDNALNVSITATQRDSNSITLTFSSGTLTLTASTVGIERVEKSNYQLLTQLEVERYANGIVSTIKTPELMLHFDGSNNAVLPLDILNSYFSEPDIPLVAESFAARTLRSAMLKYTLHYAEVFGDTPTVQIISQTPAFLLANGTLEDYFHALNRADYVTAMGDQATLSAHPEIRNYGCDNGLRVSSFESMPQYAYFLLFDTSNDSTYSRTMRVTVSTLLKDGTRQTTDKGTLTVSNFTIVRIPCSAASLDIADVANVISYDVKVVNQSGETWMRTYLLGSTPYFASVFLMQNRYGVLESFYAFSEAEEQTVEGEEVIRDGEIAIDITDTSTVYTARTGFRSRRELALVAQAMRSRFNYRINGTRPVPIVILPDSLIVSDEKEDLVEAEFSYRYTSASESRHNVTLPTYPDGWDDSTEWNDEVRNVSPTLTNQIARTFKTNAQ